MASSWRDALMKLHVRGWDTDDIDLAAEALAEACEEGRFEGTEIRELPPDDVALILDDDLPRDEIAALLLLADLRAQSGREAELLQAALYDLDAFAYEYSGDD